MTTPTDYNLLICLLQNPATVSYKEAKLVYVELSDKCQEDLLEELPLKVKNAYDNCPQKKRPDRGGEHVIMMRISSSSYITRAMIDRWHSCCSKNESLINKHCLVSYLLRSLAVWKQP